MLYHHVSEQYVDVADSFVFGLNYKVAAQKQW